MRRVAIAALLTALANAAWADHPLGGLGLGTAGPITTIPAETLPRGRYAVALQLEYLSFDAIGDARLLELAAQGVETHSIHSTSIASLGMAYGLTDDLTLGLKLPYVRRRDIREAHAHDPADPAELHALGDAKGLGDTTALAQWRFYNADRLQAGALLGAKLPTGKDDARDALGERFETEHQPGSGAWDLLLGAAMSRDLGAASLDANLLLTLTREGAQDTRLGDRLQYNAGLSYRLGGEEHPHGSGAAAHRHLAWDVIVELNGEWQDRVEIGGVAQANTGGTVVYLSPGLRLSGEGWSAFASIGIPVLDELHGVQHEPHHRVVAGVATGF